MKEHPVTELTVIRCNHNYNAWKAVRSEVGWAFAGTFRSFERPTAADAVASGALSGVPCKTVDITDAACSIAPWDTLPRAMSDAVCAAATRGDKVLSLNGYCMLAPAVAGRPHARTSCRHEARGRVAGRSLRQRGAGSYRSA